MQPNQPPSLLADFKESCKVCEGSGRKLGYLEIDTLQPHLSQKCFQCQGRGYTLTQLGEDLLELYRPAIQQWILELRLLTKTRYCVARNVLAVSSVRLEFLEATLNH